MIRFSTPREDAWLEGAEVHFIPCILAHDYKGKSSVTGRTRGLAPRCLQLRKKRRGTEGHSNGRLGLALLFWMKAAWFKQHGCRTADRTSREALLWTPLSPEAAPMEESEEDTTRQPRAG